MDISLFRLRCIYFTFSSCFSSLVFHFSDPTPRLNSVLIRVNVILINLVVVDKATWINQVVMTITT